MYSSTPYGELHRLFYFSNVVRLKHSEPKKETTAAMACCWVWKVEASLNNSVLSMMPHCNTSVRKLTNAGLLSHKVPSVGCHGEPFRLWIHQAFQDWCTPRYGHSCKSLPEDWAKLLRTRICWIESYSFHKSNLLSSSNFQGNNRKHCFCH